MKFNPSHRVAVPVFVLCGVTSVLVWLFSGAGKVDSYVIGSLVVCLGCTSVAQARLSLAARVVLAVVWTLLMPLVAGAVTGLALALLHPRVGENGLVSTLSGGIRIGFSGGVMIYPALVIAAALVQLAASLLARAARAPVRL